MLPRYEGESWIGLYHHLLMLRSRLTFDQLVGRSVEYRGVDKAAVQWEEGDSCTAICGNHIMRAGKHWATFTRSTSFDNLQSVGVVRPLPGWETRGLVEFSPGYRDFHQDLLQERTERWEGDVHFCRLNMKDGYCSWSDWTGERGNGYIGCFWEGCNDYDRDCTALDMLLDLGEGTLSVFQKGKLLGTLRDGLAGEYCWIAGCWGVGDVSIQRGYEIG